MTDDELKALVAGLAVAQDRTDEKKATDEQMKRTDEMLERIGAMVSNIAPS